MVINAEDLHQTLKLAALGYRDAARTFFESFFEFKFWVVERYQPAALTFAPPYPNDFFNVLAVADEERVIVPFFLCLEDLRLWSDQLPNVLEVEGRQLIERLPAGWWMCLNPGQDIEKEFSPWEVEQLRGGAGCIEAILEELYPSTIGQPISVEAVGTEEFAALSRALCEEAAKHPQVARVFLARETFSLVEGDEQQSLAVGVEVDATDTAEIDEIREAFDSLAAKCQIGEQRVRTVAASAVEGSLLLGVFQAIPALYIRGKSTNRGARLGELLSSLLKTR